MIFSMEKPPPPDSSPRPLGVRVSAPKCVRCAKPVEARFRPFCSQRCADIDLGAWVTGSYRVPLNEGPGESDPDDVVTKPKPDST